MSGKARFEREGEVMCGKARLCAGRRGYEREGEVMCGKARL